MEKHENNKNNIGIVGKEVNLIKMDLSLYKEDNKKKLENFWNIISFSEWNDIIEILKNNISDYRKEKFSFTIIISLGDLDNEQKIKINQLLQNLEDNLMENEFSEYYTPFLIFLVQKEEDIIDLKKEFIQYNYIDIRNFSFFISPLKIDANKEINIKKIKRKIYKIYSYFYELGDTLQFEGQTIKLYEEPDKELLPINTLVIGKTQVGKSTVINTLLKEKRAREGDNASNETEKLLTYHIDGIPLLINDIEGFTGEKNIDIIVKKIESMQASFQEKELHLILYILRYEGGTYFNDNEYEIFKQLAKNNHQSQFIFVCTRAGKNQIKAFKDIKKSFFKMIDKGMQNECKDEKSKIINTLNYLYYCQKKEIYKNEINPEYLKEKNFNEMEFYQKLELKFKDLSEEQKYDQMVNTIIEKDKYLIFVNLKKEIDHEIIFGMDKLSLQIIEVLKNIKSFNMKILSSELEKSETKINNVNQELKKNPIYEEDEQKLLKTSSHLIEVKNNYLELINALNSEQDVKKCKLIAEQLKIHLIKQANEDLKWNKIGGWASGIIPFFDILIQHYIKENAKKKISEKFDDSLTDLDKKKSYITKDEKDNVDEVKNQTDDVTSDILKSIGRTFTIGVNILSKISFFALAGIGVAFGVVVGGAVTQYDINALLEFYGNRFVYRCLIGLSFKKIEKYLAENFVNKAQD